jgi:hypothetical protein
MPSATVGEEEISPRTVVLSGVACGGLLRRQRATRGRRSPSDTYAWIEARALEEALPKVPQLVESYLAAKTDDRAREARVDFGAAEE